MRVRAAALTLAETSDDLIYTGHELCVLIGSRVELHLERVLTGLDVDQQVITLCSIISL